MFRNIYQGGAAVEVFSGQGKDPVAKWKLSGGPPAINKVYSKEVKGFVYRLEGSSQTVKMQMPANGKVPLGLLQPFLVLQVNIPQDKDFSIELVITDSGHLKRRLYLSTVHKELSSTLWHAKIPFPRLERNVWSNLCIDLVSFTGELFKDAGFLTLDGITLFATCSVRRIFTMKAEPPGTSGHDVLLPGAALADAIPRSCLFPSHVRHVSLALNMRNLLRADWKAAPANPDAAPDQAAAAGARPASSRKSRPQRGASRAASGSRAPQTWDGAAESGAQDGAFSKADQKVAAESERSLPRPSHPPRQDERGLTPPRKSWAAAPSAPESPAGRGLPSDPGVRSSWESNEEPEPEPQLAPRHRLFAFSSQPRSPRRGQGRGQAGGGAETAPGRSGRRHQAPPEDDFIGSESDEEKSYAAFQHQTSVDSDRATFTCPDATSDAQLEIHPECPEINRADGGGAPARLSPALGAQDGGRAPRRCLSPSGSRWARHRPPQPSPSARSASSASSSVSLSRRCLQELPLDGPQQGEAAAGDGGCERLGGLRLDADELRMLASLRREEEEEEEEAGGLSAARICHLGASVSSDDNSTWTRLSTVANQGAHYDKEMNPLRHSDPREWMDVLSPPIMPPSQQRRSDGAGSRCGDLIRGSREPAEEEEDDYLNLLYDPCLKCYFDPKTGKYYQLA